MEFHGVSIDSERARILDDALWVSRDGDGWKVRVAVTDVPSAVPRGGADDLVAKQVGFARIDRRGYHVRLFQPSLQRECLSLRPGSGQPVVCISLQVSAGLDVADLEIDRAELGQLLPLSFADAETFLLPGSDPALHGFVAAARDLAAALARGRVARSAPGPDPAGWLLPTWASEPPPEPDMTGETMAAVVNEIMVLANGALADFCAAGGVPLLWRAQPGTDPGHHGKSTLVTAPAWHSGLSREAYARFTSPIRRYEDVVNLRNLMAYVENDPSPHGPAHLAPMADHYNKVAEEMAETTRDGRWAAARAAAARQEEARLAALPLDLQLHHAENTGVLRSSLGAALSAELSRKNVEAELKARLLCSRVQAMSGYKMNILEGLYGNMRQGAAVLAACAVGMDVEPARIWHAETSGGDVSATATMTFRGEEVAGGPEVAATKTEANMKARMSLLAAISGTGWTPPSPTPADPAPTFRRVVPSRAPEMAGAPRPSI